MEENEKIKEAVEELTGMSKDEELRRLAELREKGRRDEHARRQYAIEEATRQGKIEIAKNMLLEGITIDIISRVTGLSNDEIEQIKNRNTSGDIEF